MVCLFYFFHGGWNICRVLYNLTCMYFQKSNPCFWRAEEGTSRGINNHTRHAWSIHVRSHNIVTLASLLLIPYIATSQSSLPNPNALCVPYTIGKVPGSLSWQKPIFSTHPATFECFQGTRKRQSPLQDLRSRRPLTGVVSHSWSQFFQQCRWFFLSMGGGSEKMDKIMCMYIARENEVLVPVFD